MAAATSPRTKRARATAGEYLRRGWTASVEGARRATEFTREQFERDPRRASIVAGVAALAVGLLLFLAIAAVGGGGGDEPAVAPNESGAQPGAGASPAGTQSGGGAAGPGTATAVSTVVATLPGNPYSEAAVVGAVQGRGLNPTLVNEPFACDNARTQPKTYRVSANGAEQRFVLLVYPDAAAMNSDWVIGAGRPQYRNGNCAAGAAVIYFNANVLLVVPQTANAGLQSQVSDAFLTLP